MDFSKYDNIRPLLPHEVPAAIEELLQNAELKAVYNSLGTTPNWDELSSLLRSCQSVKEFKEKFSANLVRYVMSKTCKSVSALQGTDNLDSKMAYTYISNHRDIILDSAILNVLAYDAGLDYPEIAIGDNLLVAPWVEKLVKLNGNFLVRRNLQGREVLLAAKELSGYMNDAVSAGISVWIAQREGRAKDSNDRTQPALLKMLSLSGSSRDIVRNLINLNIVPLTCSYEYDPCDYLKAREMQLKRDIDYIKTKAEDALNMKTGVLGYKGRVQFTLGTPLNQIIELHDWSVIPDGQRAEELARLLDIEIHKNYTLYPCNYIAWDMLNGNPQYQHKYTDNDIQVFTQYIEGQLDKIEMPQGVVADRAYLKVRILEMYANPAINHYATIK